MPKSYEHKRSVDENNQLLNDFNLKQISQNYFGWQIVVTFYTALHIVEKYLCSKYNKHSEDHKDRERKMSEFPFFHKIIYDYNTLQNQSRRARYYCINITEEDFKEAVQCLKNIEDELNN